MAPTSRPSNFNFKPLRRKRHAKTRDKAIRQQHDVVDQSLLQITSTDHGQSVENQTHVSTTLATHLLSNEFRNSNIVFSPLSIHVVLSILAAGSKGPTHDQILGFLKTNTNVDDLNALYSWLVPLIFADGNPYGGPRLCVANGVWIEKTFSLKASFKQVVDNVYKAACKEVDFRKKAAEIVDEVNLWAEKQTNRLIKQVLPAWAVDNLTSLIFANAIYFKGSWSQKFNRSETKESNFHLLDGNKVQVPFMTSSERQFVCEYDDFKVLGLPYKQGRDKRKFAMYFFLPHANDGLQSLVQKISSTSDFIDRHIPCKKVKIRKFLVPKFKISFKFESSDMLKELGLVLPFKCVDDFTEMVNLHVGETLCVSRIHHKSFVEVNEEGTEAAAVSALSMRMCCSMYAVKDDSVDFVADHPFLFVIREDVTGVVLFIGQVTNPSSRYTNNL